MEMNVILAESSPLGQAGQRVNLELTPADVHDPTELPTYLAGYRPFGYRADEASPVVLVDNDEDKYRSFSQDDTFRRVNVKGATTAAVPEVDPKTSLASYKVVDRFIGSFVPRVTELQTGGAFTNPRMAAGRRCRRAVELDREIDVWTLLTTTGNWDANNVLALGAGENWNEGASSNPIKNIQAVIETSAQMVTEVWMNQKVAHAFIRNDAVKDHMRQLLGDSPASQIAQSLAGAALAQNVDFLIPGLPPIRVAAAKVKNETTSALDYVLGNYAVLTTVPAGVPADGEEIATSWTFRRRGPSGVGFSVREFTLEDRGPDGGTMVVVAMADIAVMTGNNCGGLITGVIA